jgi:hypothetical protein
LVKKYFREYPDIFSVHFGIYVENLEERSDVRGEISNREAN